jgi:hypothetical protein
MREFEGRSYAEMAGILGLTPSALEALLFRARRALAEQLEESLSCAEAELSLSRRLDGRLARQEARRLKVHMRECPRCQRFDQSQRRQRRVLKGISLMPVPASIFLFRGETAAAAGLGAAGGGAGIAGGAAVAGAGAGAGGGIAGAGIAAGVVAKVAVATAAAAAVAGGVGYGVTNASHPAKADRIAALEQTRRGERAQHVALLKQSGGRPGPAATASDRARAATAAATARGKASAGGKTAATRAQASERGTTASQAATARANGRRQNTTPAGSDPRGSVARQLPDNAKRPAAPPAGAKATSATAPSNVPTVDRTARVPRAPDLTAENAGKGPLLRATPPARD